MKKHLSLICLSLSITVSGQIDKIKIVKPADSVANELPDTILRQNRSHFSTFDITFGKKAYSKATYPQFSSINNFQNSLPIKFIGIGISGYKVPVNRSSMWVIHMFYNQIMPETVSVSDNVKTKVNGFVYSFSFGKSISTRNENLSLSIYFIGFNTGRLKLENSIMGKQKNSFFSPKVSLQPKIIIKQISISLLVEYEIDISKSRWKRIGKSNKPFFNGIDQTGLTGLVCLGYRLRFEN